MCNRIISTYVENTKPYVWGAEGPEDHLHIRGEYTMLKIPKLKKQLKKQFLKRGDKNGQKNDK